MPARAGSGRMAIPILMYHNVAEVPRRVASGRPLFVRHARRICRTDGSVASPWLARRVDERCDAERVAKAARDAGHVASPTVGVDARVAAWTFSCCPASPSTTLTRSQNSRCAFSRRSRTSGRARRRRRGSPAPTLRVSTRLMRRNELFLHRFRELIRWQQTLRQDEIVELLQVELVAQRDLGVSAQLQDARIAIEISGGLARRAEHE